MLPRSIDHKVTHVYNNKNTQHPCVMYKDHGINRFRRSEAGGKKKQTPSTPYLQRASLKTKISILKSTQTSPNTSNSPRKLNILLHNCDTLSMNGAQVRVLEQMNHKRLGRFLQRLNRMRLPA